MSRPAVRKADRLEASKQSRIKKLKEYNRKKKMERPSENQEAKAQRNKRTQHKTFTPLRFNKQIRDKFGIKQEEHGDTFALCEKIAIAFCNYVHPPEGVAKLKGIFIEFLNVVEPLEE